MEQQNQPMKESIDIKTVEDKIKRGEKLSVEEYDKLTYARAKANVYIVLRWIGLIGVAVFGVLFTVTLVQLACASGTALYQIFGDMNNKGTVSNIFVETGWDWGPYYIMTRISLVFGAILVIVVIGVLFYFSIVDLIAFVRKKREQRLIERKASAAAEEAQAIASGTPIAPKKSPFSHKGAGRPKGSPNKPKEVVKEEPTPVAEKPVDKSVEPIKPTSVQLDAMMRWPGSSTEIALMSDAELESIKKNPSTADATFAAVKAEARTARKA